MTATRAGREDSKNFSQLMNFIMSKEEDTEQIMSMQLKLKKNKHLARMMNASGYTPLHVGIQMEAPWKKMVMLLQDKVTARQRNPAGRLPLHMALDYYPKEDVLNKLIDQYPAAVKEEDVDMRMPLHIVLEQQPFSMYFTDIAQKMVQICPRACQAKYGDGRLALHMALDRCLPRSLVMCVFQCDRSAASVAKRDGKYPLHVALENEYDEAVVAQILEAYPKALMNKMHLLSRRVLPLEFAIKKKLPKGIITKLISGEGSNNPKVLAYARAVAAGRLGKDFRAEGSSRGGKSLEETAPLAMVRQNGRPTMQSVDNSAVVEGRVKVTCLFRTEQGLHLTVLCDPLEMIEDLRRAVQATEAKALRLEESEGTWPDEQRLTYNGKQLRDGRTLASYGITKECIFQFSQRFDILHEALRCGVDDDIVLSLLGLRPESAKEGGINDVMPLHIAIMNNASPTIVAKLIDSYPQATQLRVEEVLGQYPLHIGLSMGYPTVTLEHLLKVKAHITNKADWTEDGLYSPEGQPLDPENNQLPLHMAIKHSSEGNVLPNIRLLLASGCPIEARDKATHYSAVECALAARCADEVFRFILAATRNAAPKSLKEESPLGQMTLHVACMHGASVASVDALCNLHPEALAHMDNDGRMPIHLALTHQMPGAAIRSLVQKSLLLASRGGKKGHMSEGSFPRDGHGHSLLQLAVTHNAAPGVVQQIIRAQPKSLGDLDHKGRSLIQLAVAADAPPWVLHELYSASPDQKICILEGSWPRTKAATEVMRLMGTRRDAQNQSSNMQAMLNSQEMPPPLPELADADGSESPENESSGQGSPKEGGEDEGEAPLLKEVDFGAQDHAACEYSCSIS